MAFQKRRTQQKTYKKKQTRREISSKRPVSGKAGKLFFWCFISFVGVVLIVTAIIYQKYIRELPSIKDLEKIEIAEASTIYDREGNELYNIFEEKRTYRDYEDINENMVHALVAGEDKRFFENPGIDFIGLSRAVIYRVVGRSDKLEGTSTLTQQLIRNMIITNERTAERKIKEMYLAYKLTNSVSKEKILELYLNKISFGSNAYGIEQAAKTFFGKTANQLGILESSMLASLPKGPTYYSPYNNFDRLVGYPYVYQGEEDETTQKLITKKSIEENQELVTALTDTLSQLKSQKVSESKIVICGLSRENVQRNIAVDGDGCSVIDYGQLLTLLNALKITQGEQTIEYQTGRKDFILGRMFEDGYITFDEYKDALVTSIGYEFVPYKEDIKYPHFVFYVREYLEEKYGKEILEKGGLRIYTSIDPVLQNKAQEIVQQHAATNEWKFGAQNSSLVSIDNETGEILAMVGGRDYFDEEHKGNINMATAQIQPGSSFKPFVYSIGIDKEIIGTRTPIYDVKTTFPGDYTPGNFDGKYMGKMNISTALNHSRNIPAVKMFFVAGGEDEITSWMEKLGVNTIRNFKENYEANHGVPYNYGASMALGTVMMTPLELAQAYSVYANMGYKKDLIPVIKILDSRGLVVEQFRPEENTGEEVIDPNTAYITNYMLSDTSTRPSYWNNFLSLSGRKVAAKTGTSTKQFEKNGEKIIYPRNLWTVGYTPQVTTVVWSGNNDGTQTNSKGNGLEASGPIWKDYMEFYHSDEPALEWKRPEGVKEINVSNVSGKLVPENFDRSLITSSMFVNVPQTYDASSSVKVDLLCNGAIDENTPPGAIGTVQVLEIHSLQPQNPAWEIPVQNWVAASGYGASFGGGGFVTQVSTATCDRVLADAQIEVGANVQDGDILTHGTNIIEVGYRSTTPIIKLQLSLGDITQEMSVPRRTTGIYSDTFIIPDTLTGNQTLSVTAIDNQYYSQKQSYSVYVLGEDISPPIITLNTPTQSSISLSSGDFFNVEGSVSDRGGIRATNIYLDTTPIKIGIDTTKFSQEIPTQNLKPGTHNVRIESVDTAFNKSSVDIELTILGDDATPSTESIDILPTELSETEE